MVHALLLFSGITALPDILCCLLPSSLWCPLSFLGFLGGVTLFWVVRCLPIMLLGDRDSILIFWSPKIRYVSCHCPDRRWWRWSQSTDHLLLILASWRQAFTSIVIDHRLQILDCCRWVLLWVRRASSPCLFLLGIVGLSLKGFMLAIDIASTYGFLCCTLDQWSLVKSATRSIGLQWLIFALLILPRISCL